jgi:type IV pilus assembly protein PilM
MAKSAAVWGIDIGRCALKALRCRLDGDAIVADGFDYIEYPKLLTQPEADAPQLIKEALEQFLSRNTVKGDRVAMSVSGESGLARYFKPPPVDVKKIADIVKYEARQQIPFALEDVIWDYQRMAGGQEVDGFALDTEIGLFAMKREAVQKAMAPYNTANIEIDVIQLAPISIYNYIAYDVAKELPEGVDYSSESPPPSLVVLSIGTDTTDLVVTNGYRVWQRNIPLGGNHFTRQLSKELKLTFAKAEHLKRNPKQAEDPKALFQAMRPVFADMVTEIQRSIGFFQSLDRKAKISSVVMLGNTVKLPGLVQYLSKHLGYDVTEIDSFHKLGGSSVVGAPSFKENVLAFSTCYGLCIQSLGKGKLATNLLPREILTQRLIRAKKPWAIAGISAMILACALNYGFYYSRWWEVNPQQESNGVKWVDAIEKAKRVSTTSTQYIADDKTRTDQLALLQKIGTEVVGAADRRVLWLEVMKAINKSLPPMKEGLVPTAPTPDVKTLPLDQRKDLKIQYIETEFYPDLTLWFNDTVKEKYLQLNPELAKAPAAGGAPADPNAPPPDPNAPPPDPNAAAPDMSMAAPMASPDAMGSADGMGGGMGGDTSGIDMAPQTDMSGLQIQGPTGPGWVIEMRGYHYYNDPKKRDDYGPLHVRNTLLRQLKEGFVDVPMGPGQPPGRFTMKELGIGYAILAYSTRPAPVPVENPNFVPTTTTQGGGLPGALGGAPGVGMPGAVMPGAVMPGTAMLPGAPGADPNAAAYDPENPPYFKVNRYDFAIQFVWQEKPLNVRLAEREKARLEAEAAAKAAAEAAANGSPAPDGSQPPDAAATGAPPAPPAATPVPPAPENAGAPPAPPIPGPPGPPAAGPPAAGPPAGVPGPAAIPAGTAPTDAQGAVVPPGGAPAGGTPPGGLPPAGTPPAGTPRGGVPGGGAAPPPAPAPLPTIPDVPM